MKITIIECHTEKVTVIDASVEEVMKIMNIPSADEKKEINDSLWEKFFKNMDIDVNSIKSVGASCHEKCDEGK